MSFIFRVRLLSPSPARPAPHRLDLLHVPKCRGVWSNTSRYFTNTCFRRCPKRAALRPFCRPALGRETNRPRNETPVVDLIYTPASAPAFIIYASADRELLNRSVKNTQRPFGARRDESILELSPPPRHLLSSWECNDCESLNFFLFFSLSLFFFFRLVNVCLLYYTAITLPDDGDYMLQRFPLTWGLSRANKFPITAI